MTIIKLESTESGGHCVERQSHRTENWMGDGWAIVPQELNDQLNDGYCDITTELDEEQGLIVTALTPTEKPEPVVEPTDWDMMAEAITEGVNSL